MLILVLNGVSNFVKIQIDICHNQEDTVCGAQCKYVCMATIGLNGNCNVAEIKEIFKTPTPDKQNIQETQDFLQSLMQECAKTEQVDEVPKDKKKTTGEKERGLLLLTQTLQKGQKRQRILKKSVSKMALKSLVVKLRNF